MGRNKPIYRKINHVSEKITGSIRGQISVNFYRFIMGILSFFCRRIIQEFNVVHPGLSIFKATFIIC